MIKRKTNMNRRTQKIKETERKKERKKERNNVIHMIEREIKR